MGQVTIYVEDGALDAAKRAAERAKVSVSQWFAKFAIEEKHKQAQGWDAFFAEIDHLRDTGGDDFPSIEEIRAQEVPDSPRESW
ncbi:MAG: CopG family transcriptional regulator [Polaromonas sp.]|nr:CopG family transcriptional regulator [Polaromonas sp.]